MALYLRSFLRYLHGRGLLARDLSTAIIAPRVYALEGIPFALNAEDVGVILKTARQDRSTKGLRDFAILTLLAPAWPWISHSAWTISIGDANKCESCHSKTGHETLLPLLKSVGDARLDYLQKGRPVNGRGVHSQPAPIAVSQRLQPYTASFGIWKEPE